MSTCWQKRVYTIGRAMCLCVQQCDGTKRTKNNQRNTRLHTVDIIWTTCHKCFFTHKFSTPRFFLSFFDSHNTNRFSLAVSAHLPRFVVWFGFCYPTSPTFAMVFFLRSVIAVHWPFSFCFSLKNKTPFASDLFDYKNKCIIMAIIVILIQRFILHDLFMSQIEPKE